MTDATEAIEQVRTAFATGYTTCGMVGGCHSGNIAAILNHIDAQAAEIERLRERVMDQEEKHADALREIDCLREWIACDIRCPCCQQIQTCSDDCTFSVDAPVEYERMEIARDFLAPVALLRSCRNERLA